MRRLVAFLLLILATILLAACGGSNQGSNPDEIVLKIAHISNHTHSWNKSIERLNDELMKKSEGKIRLELFPGGQLGNEKDMMQQLEAGSLDLAVITAAELSNHSPLFGAWLMPFLVNTHDEAYELWRSDESMALFDSLQKNKVKGLGYFSSGFRYYLMKSDPIQSPADVTHKKIRITPSPTTIDFYKLLQGSPTPMPVTEVYMALQTGVIDGIEIDSGTIVTEKLYEIAKQFTFSEHMYWIGGVLINEGRWNRFSEADQALIKEAVDSAMAFNYQNIILNEEENLNAFQQEHGITIHSLNKAEFMPVTERLYEEYQEKNPEIEEFLLKAEQIRNP